MFVNFLAAASLFAAIPATQAPLSTATVTPELRAALTRDYEIVAIVQPHAGDAWTRLARRVTGDAATWEDIASMNQADERLQSEQKVRVPFAMLKPSLQREVIRNLFPKDQST